MQTKINEYFEKLCKDKFFKNDDEDIIGKVKDVIENLKQQVQYAINPKNGIDEDDIRFITNEAEELIKEIKDTYSNENDVIWLSLHPMSGFYELQTKESLLEELKGYIEIEVEYPVTFTDKGFTNSKILIQYDLDGQISILAYLLKTQKWEIKNNTIIFTELLNDKNVETLIKLFNTECVISTELHKDDAINYCSIFGIEKAKESIKNTLKRENSYKAKLKKVLNDNKEANYNEN